MSLVPIAVASPIITILTAVSKHTVKSYNIDVAGELACVNYGQESLFYHRHVPVQGIEQFAKVLTTLSGLKNAILIRGTPVPYLSQSAQRLKSNFPEAETGCSWVMLDFDNLPVPEGMNPLSSAAIEYVIQKLPAEYRSVSYFYQLSSSAGIMNSDGTPLKTGLNAHVFFWFKQAIHGKVLSAYLESHCFASGFYTKMFDRSGSPIVRLGIDISVIRSSVQPHYIGLPIIGAGVNCSVTTDARQRLIKKRHQTVDMPCISDDIVATAASTRKSVQTAWKIECGFVPKRVTTRAAQGGIAVSTVYQHPSGNSPSLNRAFLRATPYGNNGDTVILYFLGEYSPGSYFVKRSSPQLAVKFGDFSTLMLKELSEGAYLHVRDVLRWFTEIPHIELSLNSSGFMPEIATFVSSRNALIEAPTGTGKTTAFCRYAGDNTSIIFYAAQTTALVYQMYDSLRRYNIADHDESSRQIRVVHYTDFSLGMQLAASTIYVTTNESLSNFIEAAADQGMNYELVIDEIHVALDDFMKSEKKNKLLEAAIGRARKAIFMTGTITSLQVAKLLDTVSRSCGALTPEVYSGYRFQAVKSNPLYLRPVAEFRQAFVALLRHYRELKQAGKTIPRTILIVPTTKMRLFKSMVDEYGLREDSCIVSRQESFQEDIEAARVSRLPILVSSPLFALGLNFDVEPVRFWAYFSYLQVDESQIIQTLNRANRGANPCEVVLFYGELDDKPVQIPVATVARMKIEEYFLAESSVQGVLDAHYQVDRVMYKIFRDAERKTAKSLHSLISKDGFQNYHIERDWQFTFNIDIESDKKEFGIHEGVAKNSYLNEIAQVSVQYIGCADTLLTNELDRIFRKKQTFGLDVKHLPRDLETQEHGVCMALCNSTDPRNAKLIKPVRIQRLFAELPPYMTAQYSHEKTGEWRLVAAEKTLALIPLLAYLKRLKLRQISGKQFARKMKQKSISDAVMALADNEGSYIAWKKRLARVNEISDLIRNKASAAQRVVLESERFKIAESFLQSIGVFFEKTEKAGKMILDHTKPLAPDWDYDLMIAELERKAVSYINLPEIPINRELENLRWNDVNVSRAMCVQCVHCSHGSACVLGRPIQPFWDTIEPTTEACDMFRKVPAKLMFKEPTKSTETVGS